MSNINNDHLDWYRKKATNSQLEELHENRLRCKRERSEAIALIQYFVDRVHGGTIRSVTTHAKYKAFLEKVKK